MNPKAETKGAALGTSEERQEERQLPRHGKTFVGGKEEKKCRLTSESSDGARTRRGRNSPGRWGRGGKILEMDHEKTFCRRGKENRSGRKTVRSQGKRLN